MLDRSRDRRARSGSRAGDLRRKQVPPDTCVWWRNVEQQRERAQTTEAEQEAEFEAFVEAVRDYAIFMLDPEGHIRSWNEGAERIKGYEEADVIGEYIPIFNPDESETDPDDLLETAADRGAVERSPDAR